MKACRIEKPGEIQIVDVPWCGDPGDDEVVVRIRSAGICGFDLHIYDGSSVFATYPNIMGHELAGEVHSLGSPDDTLAEGDRVAVDNVLPCGECYACRKGLPNVCRSVKVLGVHTPGGFQEYVRVPRRNIFRLPADISWEHAALVEPYSIASEALSRGRIEEGDTVLICGAGPIGLMILQAARLHNVRVAVLDILESRLALAAELGADLVINSRTEDAAAAVLAFSGGEGASLVFEATGNVKVLELCISKFVSHAGRVVVLGFSSTPAAIPPVEIMKRGLDVLGMRLNNRRMPEAIGWLADGRINPDPLISAVYPFEEVVQAFAFISGNAAEACKVVLKF
jgi:L-gulonate 5-dehydrogenase